MVTLTGINIGFYYPHDKDGYIVWVQTQEATCPYRRVGKNVKCVQPSDNDQIHKDYVTNVFILKISTIL
jgi:hypothetical protein